MEGWSLTSRRKCHKITHTHEIMHKVHRSAHISFVVGWADHSPELAEAMQNKNAPSSTSGAKNKIKKLTLTPTQTKPKTQNTFIQLIPVSALCHVDTGNSTSTTGAREIEQMLSRDGLWMHAQEVHRGLGIMLLHFMLVQKRTSVLSESLRTPANKHG